jgi:large subunit ribosomal protein L23
MPSSAYKTLIRPVITEDSTMLANLEEPQYVFQVAIDANKIDIMRAVEEAFGVRVKGVNTLRSKGKPRRMRGFQGRRPDTKKAFVTLEKGQSIDLF